MSGRCLGALSTRLGLSVKLDHRAGCEVCSIYSGHICLQGWLCSSHLALVRQKPQWRRKEDSQGQQEGGCSSDQALPLQAHCSSSLSSDLRDLAISSSTASHCSHCHRHPDSHCSRFSLAHRLRLWGEGGSGVSQDIHHHSGSFPEPGAGFLLG